MGLYIRKSFRAGPIRFNLSKSGLGASAGVTGARVGTGPRGAYVHGGRHGLYYRKYASSGKSRSQKAGSDSEGCATLILIAIAVVAVIVLIRWLIENPAVMVAGIALALGIPSFLLMLRLRRKRIIADYKKALDSTFVARQSPPEEAALADVKHAQDRLPKGDATKKDIAKIEMDVYQAVLDKVLDDGFITKEEAETIGKAEQILRLGAAVQLRVKKEIFSAAYVEAIQDRQITKDELGTLSNLMGGLRIPEKEVRRELAIIKEIMDTQDLRLPFEPLSPHELKVGIQKKETAYYQSPASVLTRKKSKDSPTGFEYTVKRDGQMVVTDKRVIVVGEGTTAIRYSDIADLDVDIDDGIIEVTKSTADRPVFIRTKSPIYTGRAIDLLAQAYSGGAG